MRYRGWGRERRTVVGVPFVFGGGDGLGFVEFFVVYFFEFDHFD
jgi:hypothetical protein